MDSLSRYLKLSGGKKSKGSLEQGAIWGCDSSVVEDMLLVSPLLVWSAVIHREQCSSDSTNLPPLQRCLIVPQRHDTPWCFNQMLWTHADVYCV